MALSRQCRVVVFAVAALLAAVAVAVWVDAAQMAERAGLAAGVAAAGTLRADLAALLAGMAILATVAAWTLPRTWHWAFAVMLVAVALVRSLGWFRNKPVGGDVTDLAIQLVVLAVLIGLASDTMGETRQQSVP